MKHARHVLPSGMPDVLSTFKLKRSTPDWPVDLPTLFRSIPARDLHFRMFVLATALQRHGVPAQAVVSNLHYSIFDSTSPISSPHEQTWPWSLDSRRSHPEPALRLGDKLWTFHGARRWEDALLSRHGALASPLQPHQLAEMGFEPETPLEAPPYQPWREEQVEQALVGMAAVVLRTPKELSLAPVDIPPVSFAHANQVLDDVLEAKAQGLNASIVQPDFFHNEDWLVMGASTERENALAFFQWGDPAKRAALEQQWMDQRLAPQRLEPSASPGRRPRL